MIVVGAKLLVKTIASDAIAGWGSSGHSCDFLMHTLISESVCKNCFLWRYRHPHHIQHLRRSLYFLGNEMDPNCMNVFLDVWISIDALDISHDIWYIVTMWDIYVWSTSLWSMENKRTNKHWRRPMNTWYTSELKPARFFFSTYSTYDDKYMFKKIIQLAHAKIKSQYTYIYSVKWKLAYRSNHSWGRLPPQKRLNVWKTSKNYVANFCHYKR